VITCHTPSSTSLSISLRTATFSLLLRGLMLLYHGSAIVHLHPRRFPSVSGARHLLYYFLATCFCIMDQLSHTFIHVACHLSESGRGPGRGPGGAAEGRFSRKGFRNRIRFRSANLKQNPFQIRFRSANPKQQSVSDPQIRNRLSQAGTGSLRPFPALSHFGWLFRILFQMPFRICGSETDSVSAETVSVSADKASVSTD